MENTASDPSKNPQAGHPKDDDTAKRVGHLPHGVPPQAVEEEPAGVPDSGRHETENAVTPD